MIGILGSGSWATALTKIILEHPGQVADWWVREPEIIEGLHCTGRNPFYLSEADIDVSRIHISDNIRHIVEASDDLLMVIPSAFIHSAIKDLPPDLLQRKNIHIATKGLIPETNQIITEYLHDSYGVDYSHMTVVSGPSHAEEAARERLTYLTVASSNEALAQTMREALNCHYVKTVYSDDIQGIEYATVMKNIYAIGAGLCRGLGYGDNLIAVMISNAVHEGFEFSQHFLPLEGRRVDSFAYLGDLLVTCYSQFSRNRTFGQMLGHGYSVKGAQQEMNMVAEGYYGVKGVEKKRRELGVEMPIAQAIYRILYEKADARRAMRPVLENLK